jgi:lantibiotic modifying enzyme
MAVKLPQARMYYKIAAYGVETMVSERLEDYAFRLHLVGILASLRAVQHALRNHDAKLSASHNRVIAEWWETTSTDTPELKFITSSRNLILKEGSLPAFATSTESSVGEDEARKITGYDYDLAYYDASGQRHDLLAALRKALVWCDRELAAIEAKLPEQDNSNRGLNEGEASRDQLRSALDPDL